MGRKKHQAQPRQRFLSEMTDREIIRSAEWLYWCADDRPFAIKVMTYLAERVTKDHWPEEERPPDGEELEEKFEKGAKSASPSYAGHYSSAVGDTDAVAVRGDN